MSVPTAPIISNAPRATPNALEYYWYTPANDGGSPILGYQFTLNPGPIVCNIPLGPVNRYKITGLSNAVTYTTTIAASTINGYGTTAPFREFQPGSPPTQPPSTTTITVAGVSNILLSWTPPITTPDATIFWYVIKSESSNPSDPVLKYTADGQTQSNYFIENLNINSTYYFTVSAVNCPGYSPRLSTSTILLADPFTPSLLSGLNLWLDGSDPLGTGTAPTGGTSITTWSDKSGSGNTATSAGTTPTYNSTSNAIVFGGAGHYNTNYSASLSNESLFIVYNKATASVEQPALLGPSANGGRFFTPRNTNNRLEGSVYNVAFGTIGPTNSIGLNSTIISELITTSGTQTSFVTGGSQGTSVAVTYTAGITSKVGVAFTAGAPNATNYFTGSIYEINGYTTSLTPYDRQKVEGYLAWKWSIQSNLPTSHPFRTAAPFSNSVFTPTNFSSLQIWYDGTDPLGTGILPANGDSITTWSDKSGTSTNATTSGTAATYDLSTRSLYFSGTTSAYTTSYSASLANETAFIVARLSTSATGEPGFLGSATGGRSVSFKCDTNQFVNSSRNVGFGSVTTSGTLVRNIVTVGAYTNTANTNIVYLDGGRATGTTVSLSYTAGLTTNIIGNFTNIYEAISYNRALSTGDRQTVEGYLAWKWGSQWTLPQTHPYKYNNPASLGPFTSPVTTNLQVYLTPNTYAGSGTTWDNIQNATDATLVNTPTYNIQNGFTFNGTTQAATLPDATGVTDFTTSDNYTIEIWFNAAASQATTSPDNAIVEKWDGAAGGYPYVCRWVPTGAQVKFAVYNGTTAQDVTMSTSAEIWIQAVGVFNHTSDLLSGYINGQFVTSTALTITGTIANSSLLNLARRGGATSVPFTGSIGNLRIYNTALTESQILQNFQADRGRYGI
jgi:hypothetical protein